MVDRTSEPLPVFLLTTLILFFSPPAHFFLHLPSAIPLNLPLDLGYDLDMEMDTEDEVAHTDSVLATVRLEHLLASQQTKTVLEEADLGRQVCVCVCVYGGGG